MKVKTVSGKKNYTTELILEAGDEKRDFLGERGVLFLTGGIDEPTSYEINLNIMYLDATGSLDDKPLTVILNSPGGNVDDGLAIYDTLRMLVAKGRRVDIIGAGLVASMATVIMQAGTRRLSFPHTQFLVHQASKIIGFFGSSEISHVQEEVKELERLNNIVLKVISDRAGMELDELKNLCRKTDYWLDAEGAKKLGTNGLIDEIVLTLPSPLSKQA